MAKPAWAHDPSGLLRAGNDFRLSDVATSATPGFEGGKGDANQLLAAGAAELDDLQKLLELEWPKPEYDLEAERTRLAEA